MPSIIDRITEHTIWSNLGTLQTTLAELKELETLPPDALEPITRAHTVTTVIHAKLRSLDPALVTVSTLDAINSATVATNNELRSYLTNSNTGHLNNTTTHLDSMLANAAQLLPISSSADVEPLRETIVAIRRAAGQHTRYLEQELIPLQQTLSGLTTRVQQLSDEITTQRLQVTTVTTTFQDQFSTAQETRRTEFTTDQRTRQDEFATAQQERSTLSKGVLHDLEEKFTTTTDDLNTKAETVLDQLRANATATTADLQQRATQTLAAIDTHRQDAATLLGVIGDIGITSGYQKTANEARLFGRIWQSLTIVAMGFLIWIAYSAFLPAVKGTFTWEGFAGRVFVTLTVGVLAAYCARQGDRHGEVERTNRRRELELQSLGPYLLPLSAEKQEELRATIADRTFGHHDASPTVTSPATLVDLLTESKEFRELLTDVIKAAK